MSIVSSTQGTALVYRHQLWCPARVVAVFHAGARLDVSVARQMVSSLAWSSLMPCTTLGWHCTRSVFSCSTWSRILLCGLLDEQTPPDPIIPEAEQHKQQEQ